jgi:hypothetical protein
MSDAQRPVPRAEHGGYFRVEEEALRKLRSTYDRPSAYRLALLSYVTLCRVANLEGSETFVRSVSSIGQDAGLSYNAAAEGLALVESAGLVKIEGRTVEGTKERAPSLFRLVRMFLTDCATSPTESGTSPTEKGRFPKTRNSQVLPIFPKNSPKNVPRTSPRELRPTSQNEISEYLLSLKAEASDALTDAEYLWLHWTENGFTNGGKPIKSWKLTVQKWKAAGFLPSAKRMGAHLNGRKPSGLQDHQTF